MVHTFTHIFKNGQKLTLSCDLTGDTPVFSTKDKEIVDLKNEQEYCLWYVYVVLPQIMDLVSDVQLKNLSKLGAEILNKENKKKEI